jgi:hypothetical protein
MFWFTRTGRNGFQQQMQAQKAIEECFQFLYRLGADIEKVFVCSYGPILTRNDRL